MPRDHAVSPNLPTRHERFTAAPRAPAGRLEIVRAAAAYFALVFAAGFAFGVVRVLWLVPRLGERWAELAEAPLIVAAIVLAARWTVRRPARGATSRGLLALGAIALAVLLSVELTVVLALRGLSLAAYVASRDPVAGTVYVALLALFAVMPRVLAGAAPTPAGRSAGRP